MRAVLGIVLIFIGLTAMAQEQILAEGTDNEAPKVELQLPKPGSTPLIQSYRTENGDLAAVVTPQEGDEYFVVPVQQAYQTQNPQDREADVPINTSNWIFVGW